MKRLKLVQDELDIDYIHVYAPHQKRMLRVCTIHVDTIDSLFSSEIVHHFGKIDAESLMVNTYGPDWTIE